MSRIISQESIEQIKQSIDMLTVVSEYVHLENRGINWFGCCPFHNEKTPSFSVNTEKNLYHCFGCKAGGSSVFKFVQEIEHISFPEAVEKLAEKTGVQLKYEDGDYVPDESENRKKEYITLYSRVATTFHYFLTQTEAGTKALNYIKNRGISDEIIERFNLGYAPADRFWLKKFLKSKNFSDDFLAESGLFSRDYKDISFFNDRFMFPIFNKKGEVVAFGGRTLDDNKPPKYLNSKDLDWYQKGEILFGYNFASKSIRQNKKIILCEGYMDCIAYHQCGIEYAVAPLGTALTELQINLFEKAVDEVLLSFDSDDAGQNATKRAILMCRKRNLPVRVIHLKGGKDPAEIMINFGKDYLTMEVENSIFDFDHLVMSLTQKYSVDTPEGKANIAMELFEYVDALQSDIQKESILNLIAQKIGLSIESIQNDFNNREQVANKLASYSVLKRQNEISQDSYSENKINVKPDAEFRAILAVIADMNLFKVMNAELNENDFENPLAKALFIALKECYKECHLITDRENAESENIGENDNATTNNSEVLNNVSQPKEFSFDMLQKYCHNQKILQMITESLVSGEYSKNTEQSVLDSIRTLKRKSLSKKQMRLQTRIQELQSTSYDGEELLVLIEEKMSIDKMLNERV